ncbi:CCA tRNA nucleotidyltransferase [Helicobacter cholecystus]|uniref:CCA tRNA nucleotidyltransferase n=1 Tax=Helicobacter cholecystus TaxID=45498 RepID=UPI0027399021|nr:CCA tRNA nucleotidyltransferase [Helicobacter cholecystus]
MKEIVPSDVLQILQTLQSYNFTSYLVGGCVRDYLLGFSPKDWDICTPASPEKILEIFPEGLTFGKKYGTIGIKTPIGIVQITTFRTESHYQDFRHPQVNFCTNLFEDLKRRDFTINAMAYNPQEGLIDYFEGQNDLANQTLRCIGESKERFQEDALRLLRLIRFSSKFDLNPHPDTLQGALNSIPLLSYISKERIRDELLEIFHTSFWGKYFQTYRLIYSYVLPELSKPFKHKIPNLSILFSYIFQKQEDLKALQRLKIDKITSKRTAILFAHKYTKIEPDKIKIKFMLNKMGYDNFCALLELQKLMDRNIKEIYKILQNIMIADECFLLKDLKINGNDLIALGYKKEKIGEILEKLLHQVIKGETPNEKQALLSYC